eukprot:TRINITY_DN6303_c0_g1_i1.p1 TRINITY_DN6303_c0_g1~~TRINITY_DN6303_c0_g1_i1.p1  ORF type:complete len:726 (+),score=194.34 TRINITY_DN6303_c0_g1_i1:29-2206(+)
MLRTIFKRRRNVPRSNTSHIKNIQRTIVSSSTTLDLEHEYGKLVFGEKAMSNRLPQPVYKKFKQDLAAGRNVDPEVANVFAHALKEWALEKGVTHYAHWFQPFSGTAEKHDGFIKPVGGGNIITSFSGKLLTQGEPDASSFPSGGLRETHEARGYTVWDPNTPVFIKTIGGVRYLCISCGFFSWKGHALDKKIPLLRSKSNLNKTIKKLLSVMGENQKDHGNAKVECGVEQEFFLIDSKMYQERPDLIMAGRTLQGADPPKGQELSDHYFGVPPERVISMQNELEKISYKLGLDLTTRHQEVAPNQFECAPVFSDSSLASDLNLIFMDTLKKLAPDYGLATLFHEKPFQGVNGSGKHNNWSFGTDKVPTWFNPGKNPAKNKFFLIALASVVRGLDQNQDLLRYCIQGAGNDHRLGANEAPPAVFSIYLGEEISNVVSSVINGTEFVSREHSVDLGIDTLPIFKPDNTDRNRTSPFAFTGNKFEFRAVGSSQGAAFSNLILNVITIDSLEHISNSILKKKSEGMDNDEAIMSTVKEIFTKHQRIMFDGDNYSAEWKKEAEKRGLSDYKSTPDVLNEVLCKKNYDIFKNTGVLSNEELTANVNVELEQYIQHINIEAKMTTNLANQYVLPTASTIYNSLAKFKGKSVQGRVDKVSGLVDDLISNSDNLEQVREGLFAESDNINAKFATTDVIPSMNATRNTMDEIEKLAPAGTWPYPTYQELLFKRW